jgi:tetratricopeptide (TPR) repeat protein
MNNINRLIRLTAVSSAVALALATAPAFAQDTCDPALDHYRAGNALYTAGDFAAAYTSFGCFLEQYPASAFPEENAEILNMRGNALREQGDWEGAIAEYTLAIEVQDDYAIAYNNRGWAHFNLDNEAAALADYNSALQYDPTLAYAWNNRGLIYQYRGDRTLAAADFEQAIALGFDASEWAQYNLNLVELLEARQGNSLEPAAAAPVGTENDAVNTFVAQGIAADAARDWRGVISAMSEALALDANNTTAAYLRGRAYIAMDDFEGALADFERLVTLVENGASYPALQYAYWERAVAYAETGNLEAAYADAERATMLDPGQVNNFIVRGTLAVIAGDFAIAGQEFLGVMLCTEMTRETLNEANIGSAVTVSMSEGRVVSIPFRAEAGQVITLSARSSGADPVISLLDPTGTPVSGDDDSGFMLASLIEDYTVENDGMYTLMVSHAGGGSEGMITVSITAAD